MYAVGYRWLLWTSRISLCVRLLVKTLHRWELENFHFRPLPVWVEGNAYLAGALSYKNEKNKLIDADSKVIIELSEEDGHTVLETNVFDLVKDFEVQMITSDVLGEAFEPGQRFENPDGSEIIFNTDYFGDSRGMDIIPGPFGCEMSKKIVY